MLTSRPPLPTSSRERRFDVGDFSAALTASLRSVEPSADLEGASVLGEGWACVAYRVPTSRGDLALRVPKPGSWWAAPDLEREAALLPLLESRGLPVPREARILRGAGRGDEGGMVLGALQTVIAGRPAHELPRGRAERAQLARDLGGFLWSLHAMPLSGPESPEEAGVSAAPGWAPQVAKRVEMWEGHYQPMLAQAAARLPMASARWLEARGRRFLDEGGVAMAPRALIHGDCSSNHVLVSDDGRLAGVIDWADAMVGDPALDFAAILDDYPRSFFRGVMQAYEGAGGTVDPDAMRRVAFYLDVAPVFGVLFAEDGGFPEVARADRARFAARAAAAARTSKGGR